MPDTMKTAGDAKLAQNLRRIREGQGMTRPKLESLSGVSDITIYVAETSRRNLQVNTVRALADALGVTMGDLLD